MFNDDNTIGTDNFLSLERVMYQATTTCENFCFSGEIPLKKKVSEEKKRIDYYPGGMAMPNQQIVGGQPYRYGYQGEFAETDPETGKPAFQLRLYDPRLGRWISPDPKNQYPSPYMSMGNNWISRVDPDGGNDCPDPPCNDIDSEILDEIVITSYIDKIKESVFNTVVGWGNVLDRTWNWFEGTEPVHSKEIHNDFANAFKDASGIEKARQYFYDQLNRGRNLFDHPVTDYGVNFGLDGLKDAGVDPYEQFVGSYVVSEMILVKTGKDTYEIQYTLHNRTHFKSLAYRIPGGPSWERSTFAPMSNITQEIIFSEPLVRNRLNKGVFRYINHNLNGRIR